MVGKRFIFFGFVPIVGIQIAQRFSISDFFSSIMDKIADLADRESTSAVWPMPCMVGKRFIFFGFVPIVGIQIAQCFSISDFFSSQTSRIENRLRSVVNAIHGEQVFHFFWICSYCGHSDCAAFFYFGFFSFHHG